MKHTWSSLLRTICALAVLLIAGSTSAANAQYIALGAGGLFPQDQVGAGFGNTVRSALSEFGNSGLLAVDVGVGFLPFLGAGLHYSYSSPELVLRRGDAFGSSAVSDLGAHTLTLEANLRTPEIIGFRLYGLAGGGLTSFTVNLKQIVEVPFPRGDPDNVVSPVLSIGVGIERSLGQLVGLKFEVRDYVTPISKDFFEPGGTWHRMAFIGGIVLGR